MPKGLSTVARVFSLQKVQLALVWIVLDGALASTGQSEAFNSL